MPATACANEIEKPRMAVKFGYFWDDRLTQRTPGATCPEQPKRLGVLSPDHVLQGNPATIVRRITSRKRALLLAVHDESYVTQVETASEKKQYALDNGGTRVTPDIFDQALLAASVGCAALDELVAGRLERAFCAIRPPGHHANSVRALGYCIFNNAAIAARYAQERGNLERVLIVDWDLDPGNGTQEIFYEDPTVFTLSFHQSNLFPQAGRVDLVGRGDGEGFNRNVVFEPGTAAGDYLAIFEREVCHVCANFPPELLIIAAGFDAHQLEQASRINLTENDFATMTKIVLDAAQPTTGGSTLSLLEGGYHIAALQLSVAQHVRIMATYEI